MVQLFKKDPWSSLSPEERRQAPTIHEVVQRARDIRDGKIKLELPKRDFLRRCSCPACGSRVKSLPYVSMSIGAPAPFAENFQVWICFECGWWYPKYKRGLVATGKGIKKIKAN